MCTRMALRCTECGKDNLDNYRSARGHVKFKSGGGHGAEGEVPDDYRSLFEEMDTEGNDGDDSGGDSADDSGGSDSGSATPSGGGSTDSNPEDTGDGSGLKSRLSKAWNEDVSALWRGL